MATSREGRHAEQQSMETQGLTSRESPDRDGGIALQVLLEKLQSRVTEDPPRHTQAADTNDQESVPLSLAIQDAGSQSRQTSVSKWQNLIDHLVKTAVLVVPKESSNAYVDHYNCCPPPLFMITISIVELAIFIGYAIVQNGKGIPTTMTSGAPLESPLVYNPYRRYEAWRFLSYMFIHDGMKHIISNLIFQLVIGIPLEMVHKFWRVGIVYCLGVIAGSLCTSVFDPWTFLVGASGGCYALIGAHFAIVIMNWQEMMDGWMSSPKKFLLSAPVRLAFWTIYAGVDTAVAIYTRYTDPEGSRVAYAAHFAGLAAGILMGIPVLKNIRVEHWEKKLWWISLVVYLVLVLFAVCWNGFYPNYYPPTDWRPCCPCPYGYKCLQ